MKAQYLTLISTTVAWAMTSSMALAQSSTVPPRETKLSLENKVLPLRSQHNFKISQAAPAPEPRQQPQPQAPAQAPATPQPQVSQEELQKFANAIKKLQPIQQDADTQAVQVVRKQNLSEQRFGEIYQARKNPQAQLPTPVTSEENKQFDQAAAQIVEIQKATQSKMERAVQDVGLDVRRFNQILVAVQQNPTLRQKVQQMIRS